MFQPLIDVLDQSPFIVVDVDSGGDVHSGDQYHPFLDAALVYDRLNLRGDMYICSVRFGMKLQVFSEDFHKAYTLRVRILLRPATDLSDTYFRYHHSADGYRIPSPSCPILDGVEEVFVVFRLDYLSCVLTIGSTILVGRR